VLDIYRFTAHNILEKKYRRITRNVGRNIWRKGKKKNVFKNTKRKASEK
jgi:hypothetical protein